MSGPPRPSPAVVVAESRGISWVMHSWRLLVSDTHMMFQSPVIFRIGDISANDRLRDQGNMQCNPRGLCWDFSGRGSRDRQDGIRDAWNLAGIPNQQVSKWRDLRTVNYLLRDLASAQSNMFLANIYVPDFVYQIEFYDTSGPRVPVLRPDPRT
jgi:hypothetical protein